MSSIENEKGINKSDANKKTTGTIFDIKRYAINDGPGIRTTFFLKGCPLNCQWCHNPESISFKPELTFRKGFCINCKSCASICPSESMTDSVHDAKPFEYIKETCTACGNCADICPTQALAITGRKVSVDDVLFEAEKDKMFYDNSGGGVTFSGGEPLAQPKFLASCLSALKDKGIHCTVDTSCYTTAEVIAEIIPLADLFLCDVKHMNSEIHKKVTGVENKIIFENISTISNAGKPIIIRTPLIPGINDDQDNIEKTKEFASSIKTLIGIDFLPYNSGGQEKKAILI